MSVNLMFTAPSHHYNRRMVREMIEALDIHKWVIGFEIGKKGYRHIQGRVRVSKAKEDAFIEIKKYLDGVHIELCSDTWEYERKDGRFLSSEDTPEIRAVRFGKPRWYQEVWLNAIRSASDRTITIIYDELGNHGKSWLVNHLWETGKAFYVPPMACTVEKLIQFVASGYKGQEMITIDIPRAWKWSEQLYTAVESLKDGLVFDTRYHSLTRNIRGVKVAVFCNVLPKLDKLSVDRWDIIDVGAIVCP